MNGGNCTVSVEVVKAKEDSEAIELVGTGCYVLLCLRFEDGERLDVPIPAQHALSISRSIRSAAEWILESGEERGYYDGSQN